jgi:hypothetical protein
MGKYIVSLAADYPREFEGSEMEITSNGDLIIKKEEVEDLVSRTILVYAVSKGNWISILYKKA